MKVSPNLEKEFISTLRELNNKEQDAIRIFSAIYVNSYENLKRDKAESLEKSITEQIKFYGRKKDEYLLTINQMVEQYTELMERVISSYNIYFCVLLNKLQDAYNNQKIAMTNAKLSIDSDNEVKKAASEYKVNNYEIVIQECKRQLEECKMNMEKNLNEIFYSRDKGLSLGKVNILQKIINLLTGKAKVNNFVILSLNREMEELETIVNRENERIEQKTMNRVAMIEDAILQTQTIFNNMLKEYGYDE